VGEEIQTELGDRISREDFKRADNEFAEVIEVGLFICLEYCPLLE
jgi:hypothetical protein